MKEASIYTDNHLFGHKAEAKIFIFPPIFEDCFLKSFKLIFAPMLISNVFIKYYHRSGNNLLGKNFQDCAIAAYDKALPIKPDLAEAPF